MPDVIPDWRELHHFVVPFPILLLSIAPFLVIVGIGISVPKRRLFLGLALTFVVLGTEATFVAVATGEAAMNPVDPSPAFKLHRRNTKLWLRRHWSCSPCSHWHLRRWSLPPAVGSRARGAHEYGTAGHLSCPLQIGRAHV